MDALVLSPPQHLGKHPAIHPLEEGQQRHPHEIRIRHLPSHEERTALRPPFQQQRRQPPQVRLRRRVRRLPPPRLLQLPHRHAEPPPPRLVPVAPRRLVQDGRRHARVDGGAQRRARRRDEALHLGQQGRVEPQRRVRVRGLEGAGDVGRVHDPRAVWEDGGRQGVGHA
ncbi:uncharacterized protein E0L32_005056 [Thyridium curvatum]|uniref:Uncharacterized protein n=1 Tax=Thyridium curvatum TaxID=1093900 RepID=A0A507B5B1_9PEZI|nr:uncharacterized protein E0L32_005056 [Thyridium curvatum]TPX14947.1 hypothetical protein E0L32_005056 [Thyridium curvatum]